MARPREYTMDEIEAEIARLQKSEAVRLARKEQKIYNKRKAYMSALLGLEKRGKELEAHGITMENMRAKLFSNIPEDDYDEA